MSEAVLKAVALRYPDWADAPYISALAEGRTAQYLLEVAEAHDIPVVQNSDMVNVLSIQSVGDFIPEETYAVIAGIFAFIAKVEKKANE